MDQNGSLYVQYGLGTIESTLSDCASDCRHRKNVTASILCLKWNQMLTITIETPHSWAHSLLFSHVLRQSSLHLVKVLTHGPYKSCIIFWLSIPPSIKNLPIPHSTTNYCMLNMEPNTQIMQHHERPQASKTSRRRRKYPQTPVSKEAKDG